MKNNDIDESKDIKNKKIKNKKESNSQKVLNDNKINEKEFNIQLNILKESNKIKINIESIDKNNTKIIFSNSFSLNDLITFNPFFENFEEPLEAFEYLIKNYNKIDKKKITNINNNKDIKLILPFLISENNNIYEDSIEVILHNITNSNINKSTSNLVSIINNLKNSLEKFNISIKELKSNIDKDKMEKDKKIKELENYFIDKIKEIKNNDSNISKTTSVNTFDIKNYNINDNNLKNIENIIEEKFDERMKVFEEKIQILNNKVINLEIRNQNKIYDKSKNEESFLKDISFNDSIIYEKFDKKIQVMNNSMNNKLKKLANKLNINLKDMELDNSYNNIIDNKNNEILNNNDKINDLKLMNEISNKVKAMNVEIDNKIKNYSESKIKEIINIKIQEIKKEIYSVLNKINDRGKEDYKDLNNKILALKNDLIKTIDYKYNITDNKIKIVDGKGNKIIKDNQIYLEKMNYLDIKIKSFDNKIKQIDYKFEDKNKNDINSSINNNNLNNSYIIPNSRNILSGSNIMNSNDENEINNQQRNTSFNLSSNIKGKINDKSIEIDSIIINNEYANEDYFLFSKIKKVFPFNRVLKYNLIYRATKDGDASKNFHSKCDFIGPNIILIKTKEDYIFGGFTTKSWKHLFKDINKDEPELGTELKDEKAFGFSINEKKIYNNGNPNESIIYCNNNYGPVFKNYFKIFNECLKNGGLCGKKEESYFVGQEKDYEINGGKEKFDIEELEIFQIGFK